MMKLSNGWQGAFIDSDQRIVLTKPGRNQTRRIYMQYSEPFLKRVDAVGVAVQDNSNPIAPAVRMELLAACRERRKS